MRKPLSRRTLLRAAGGIGIALPFLDAMTAYGAPTTAFNKRFVAVVSFDGTNRGAWVPTGTETNFNFGQILQPLTPNKSKLLVFDGIDNVVSYNGPAARGHGGGTSCLLSGAYTQVGNVYCGGGGCLGWGGGISIDQQIAKTVGANDPVRVLNMGVQPSNVPVQSYISYSALAWARG